MRKDAPNLRLNAVVAGLRSYLPRRIARVRFSESREPDSLRSARYSYSVWLRHLVTARQMGLGSVPEVVAELGPGWSLGVGLAALLSGAGRYYALDATVRRSNTADGNRRVLGALLDLFATREPIPGEREFPSLKPTLDAYRFPGDWLRPENLLRSERVTSIQEALVGAHTRIQFICPWARLDAVPEASVDFLLSQAVLEHVSDLELVYAAMSHWVKGGGYVSHEIDFKSHGTAEYWNGHWAYRDTTWRLIRGRRPYLLNRQPLTVHLDLLERHGFEVMTVQRVKRTDGLPRHRLQPGFQTMSDEDLVTSGGYVLARRRNDR